MNEKKYKIKNNTLIIRDRKSAKTHIKQGDYFGTIATILNLLSQDKFIKNTKELKKYLKKISKELEYLQKNFDIKKSLK
ncbi:hypothetical protein CVU82_03265 [Candidatus Falkowbacteria bacterium HGW-Falkowbacteria-1]|jgi:hypothetical protein|uniref:Uncharacterized protein n=1 Tax=Candidatus Falkowbacteria bacterium HGW-Falkowbacteria-1 TaxID=2013768 RepID=A0A2N2E8I4_9BACT|nr:MAG: hypothetical protein CVU82_03265 [Candidatus Falkowbacteria bacterium HGW-Falkowbacteria-1]